MSEGGSAFSRWSRLKQAARRGGATPVLPAEPVAERRPDVGSAPPTQAIPAAAAAPPTTPGDDAPSTEEVLALPPIDSLTATSDFSPFLREGVPEHLRSAAMRVLWRSDAAWAAPEIMDIHNLDYSFPVVPEVVNTAYRVGRGFVDEVLASEEPISGVEPVLMQAPAEVRVSDQATGDPEGSGEGPSRNGAPS